MPDKNGKVTNRALLEETHDTVTQLKTVLVGIPGTDDKGLVGEVKSTKNDINALHSRHRKLDLRVWILIAVLTASGAISAGELTNIINLFG